MAEHTHAHTHTYFIQAMRYAVRHWVTTVTMDGPNLCSKAAQIREYGEGNQKIQKQIMMGKQEKAYSQNFYAKN